MLVLGTPFAKPQTLLSRASGLCCVRERAARFMFQVPFSLLSNRGTASVEAVGEAFVRVWIAGGGGGAGGPGVASGASWGGFFAAPGSVAGADKSV